MALGRLELNNWQKGKIGAHVAQALFTFIALCVLIAMFAQEGQSDGRGKWYLALCFLSIPAWVYLIMTPMWERTVKFANAFAMAAVDVVYTIFWFSAIIALAVWVSDGKNKGAEENKISGGGNCTTFAYGTEKKCELADAAVGLAVPVFLFWIASSVISVYFILRWRKGEGLPWNSAKPKTYQEADSLEPQGKDNAWSSDMQDGENPLREDSPYQGENPFHGEHGSDEGVHALRPDGQEEDEHTLLHSTETDEGRHPGTPWGSSATPPPSYMPDEHEYQQNSRYSEYGAPSALSPADYEARGAYENYRTGNNSYASPDYR